MATVDRTTDRSQQLLSCVGALEQVSATARKLGDAWDSRVLPAHAELERLCASFAEEDGGCHIAPGGADSPTARVLGVGSAVHFVQRSGAAIDATLAACAVANTDLEAQAASVLGAAVRLPLCALVSDWLDEFARSHGWAVTLFPIVNRRRSLKGLHQQLLRCCDNLLSMPRLSATAAPKLFAASLLLRPTSVPEALRSFFEARAR